MKKIALINHGCAKNLVDSELMLGMLAEAGFEITLDESDCDVVIVNTCSFIHDAEAESVQTILEMINEGKKVVITGCLSQRHKMEIHEAIPEAVAMIGPTDISKIVDVIKKISAKPDKFVYEVSEKPDYIYPEMIERQQITVGASSYIKIADGCNYQCGYCIIPQLRGLYRSRPIENIVEEAKKLVDKGVTEIVLVAQDTTSYGIDIYEKPSLANLLKELEKIENLQWLRVMYAYPSMFTDELIEVFKNSKKIVKYIDIPLQHSHPEILKAMRRPGVSYEDLIAKIRNNIDGIAIRTTFIVGYPGEKEEHFNHLKNFIERVRFDRLGVFEYSREKNTYSFDLDEQVDEKTKQARKNEIMELQQGISLDINQTFVGKEISCIVEMITDEGLVVGRTYRDAPEIDGLIYIDAEDEPVLPGDIVNVVVTTVDAYDMHGKLVC